MCSKKHQVNYCTPSKKQCHVSKDGGRLQTLIFFATLTLQRVIKLLV